MSEFGTEQSPNSGCLKRSNDSDDDATGPSSKRSRSPSPGTVIAEDALALEESNEARYAASFLENQVKEVHSLARFVTQQLSNLREVVYDFEQTNRVKFSLANEHQLDFLDSLRGVESGLETYNTSNDEDEDPSRRAAARQVVVNLCRDGAARYKAGEHGMGRCSECHVSISGAQCMCSL